MFQYNNAAGLLDHPDSVEVPASSVDVYYDEPFKLESGEYGWCLVPRSPLMHCTLARGGVTCCNSSQTESQPSFDFLI